MSGNGITEWEFSGRIETVHLEKSLFFVDHYIVSNYGILTGLVNYTAEKFGLKSADLDVVARNRLLKNSDFQLFLQDLLPTSVQEVGLVSH